MKEKKTLPQYAAKLLKLHYTNGNPSAAASLRASLYVEYGDDTVDEYIAALFNEEKDRIDQNYPQSGMCMAAIIADLTQSGETSLWAIKLVQSALEFPMLLDVALVYIESDADLVPYFLPLLTALRDNSKVEIITPTLMHLYDTCNYLEELNANRNMIHDIKPEWITRLKELVNSDDDDDEDALEDFWSDIEEMSNGATANKVIIQAIEECITVGDDVTLSNIMLCGFEGVAYFNEDITHAPFIVTDYVLYRQADKTRDEYVTDNEIIEAVFAAITDMLLYMCDDACSYDDCDENYILHFEMWKERFLKMKDEIIAITGTASYQEFIEGFDNAIAEIMDNDDDDEAEYNGTTFGPTFDMSI